MNKENIILLQINMLGSINTFTDLEKGNRLHYDSYTTMSQGYMSAKWQLMIYSENIIT